MLLDRFSCGRVSLRPNQRWRQGGRRGLEQGRDEPSPTVECCGLVLYLSFFFVILVCFRSQGAKDYRSTVVSGPPVFTGVSALMH